MSRANRPQAEEAPSHPPGQSLDVARHSRLGSWCVELRDGARFRSSFCVVPRYRACRGISRRQEYCRQCHGFPLGRVGPRTTSVVEQRKAATLRQAQGPFLSEQSARWASHEPSLGAKRPESRLYAPPFRSAQHDSSGLWALGSPNSPHRPIA